MCGEKAHAVRWGILGTADIARISFLPGVKEAGGEVVAVGSRSAEKAERFAAEWGISKAYGSYEAVLDDPGVEAVYIPLPNTMHAEWIAKAAEAGKHVFCEKPLTLTAREAEEAVAACRKAGVHLAEAFVYHYHRQTGAVRRLLESGAIGEVKHTDAVMHYTFSRDPGDIRLNPELGGGALFDVGCYVLSWARLVMGESPEAVAAHSVGDPSGVDSSTLALLRFSGGRTASVSSGIRMNGGQSARVYGSEGVLEVSHPFHPRKGSALIVRRGMESEEHSVEIDNHPFTDAISRFQASVRSGEPLPVSGEELVEQARLLEACRTAAESGSWVKL